jgi:hypothetical protein
LESSYEQKVMKRVGIESEYEANGEGERWARAEVIWWGLQAELTILAVAVYPIPPRVPTCTCFVYRSLVRQSQKHE